MWKTMELIDDKIAMFTVSKGEQPDFIIMGNRSYLELCREVSKMNKREVGGQEVLISKYRDCEVIIIASVDIMVEIGITGEQSLHYSKNLNHNEANA